MRPRAGVFGYRHWLGIALRSMDGLREQPATVKDRENGRSGGRATRLLVAGWAMDNMKALDYLHARPPLVQLGPEGERRLNGMVAAAEHLVVAVRGALAPVLAEGEAREAVREDFYIRTQGDFEKRMAELARDPADDMARRWLADLRRTGRALFEGLALPGLADRVVQDQKAIVDAHRGLVLAFGGWTPQGRKAFDALELPPPEKKRKEAA